MIAVAVITISWLFLFITEISCTNLMDINWVYVYVPFIGQMAFILIKSIVFIWMMHLMRWKANSEYLENKGNYIRYFTSDLLFYTFQVVIVLLRKKDGFNLDG